MVGHSEVPESLLKSLKKSEIVPVVGPGIVPDLRSDKSTFFTTWKGFLESAARELMKECQSALAAKVRAICNLEHHTPETAAKAYEEAAESVQEGLRGLPWLEFLDGKFRSDDVRLRHDSLAVHQAIWSYGSRTVLTVNYDDLLERGCPASYIRDLQLDRPVPSLGDRYRVWHLCGYIHDTDLDTKLRLVPRHLKPSSAEDSTQAQEAYERHTRAIAHLKEDVAKKTLLFVGFDEPSAVAAVKWIMSSLEPESAYLIIDPANTTVLTQLGMYTQTDKPPLSVLCSHDPSQWCIDLAEAAPVSALQGSPKRQDSQVTNEAGTIIGGRYQLIQEERDSSLISDLWRAFDQEEGKLVWVRLLKSKHRSSPDYIRRFGRGARLTKSLEHPAMLRILATCKKEDSRYYHVTEFFHGQALSARVKGDTAGMTVEAVLLVTTTVADALIHMHERGLVHRDITPHTVFVDRHGGARIADFDLVTKYLEKEHSYFTRSSLSSGDDRAAYLAPELRAPDGQLLYDFSTDIYALAATTLFCLTGKNMLELAVDPGLAKGWIEELPCDHNIKFALEKALHPTKESRCSSAREFLRMLIGVVRPVDQQRQEAHDHRREEQQIATTVKDGQPEAVVEPYTATQLEAETTSTEKKPPERSSFWKNLIFLAFGLSVGLVAGFLVAQYAGPREAPGASTAVPAPTESSPSVVLTGDTLDSGVDAANDADSPKLSCPSGVLVESESTPPFCIQEKLVTGQAYAQCVEKAVCSPATCIQKFVYMNEQRCPTANGTSKAVHCWVENFPDKAVNCLNIERAEKYCADQGGKLATKNEWLTSWGQGRLLDVQVDTLELVGSPGDYWMLKRQASGAEILSTTVQEKKIMSERTRLRCAFAPTHRG